MSQILPSDHFLCYYCKDVFLHPFTESIDCLSCKHVVCKDCYYHETFTSDDRCAYCEMMQQKEEHVQSIHGLFAKCRQLDDCIVDHIQKRLNEEYYVMSDENGTIQIKNKFELLKVIKCLGSLQLSSDEEYESMSD
jgi:hypothetical protein